MESENTSKTQPPIYVCENESKKMSQILIYLEEQGCCPRCCLRLLEIRDISIFLDTKLVQQKLDEFREEISPTNKRLNLEIICILCLGLLNQASEPFHLENIVKKIEAENFQFKDFLIQLSLPVTITLREHLFNYQLKTQFGYIEKEIPCIKEVWKWVASTFLTNYFGKPFNSSSQFSIFIETTHSSLEAECQPLKKYFPQLSQIPSRQSLLNCLEKVTEETLSKAFPEPIKPSLSSCLFKSVTCCNAPIYLGGRYLKLSRELCQTPWLIDGIKQRDTSVQELMTGIVEQFVPCEKIMFSSSGREDVDVRMLGSGRPFLLELVNPKVIDIPTEKIQNEINKGTQDLEVRQLTIVDKNDVSLLKEGEEKKKKTYSALCLVDKDLGAKELEILTNTKDLIINQKTPIRVLHRRSNLVRQRIIYEMKAEFITKNKFKLDLVTQAGTYIKEFAHGDFGRTQPNLASILNLNKADIQELDVLDVDLNWPPLLNGK